ncbi:MAG: Dabb family protein [Planctomycetaceae bacterium]
MSDSHLAHLVFFKLKDSSAEAAEGLVEACHKYLSGHEGTVYFSAGTLAPEFERPVNDRDFDVSLQVVFESRAAHDAYQINERHLQFVEEMKEGWDQVRVFDTWVR